jgi:hypothetical protein
VNPLAEEKVKTLEQVQHDLVSEFKQTQERQKEQADHRRMDHPNFKIGDKVWLLKRNIATTRPCAKLDYKRLRPFKITEFISPVACWLELPP